MNKLGVDAFGEKDRSARVAQVVKPDKARVCARRRGELEIAEWIAERELEGFTVAERRLSPEEAEGGGRIFKRPDRLGEEIDALYKALGLKESERGGRYSLRSTRQRIRPALEGTPPAW